MLAKALEVVSSYDSRINNEVENIKVFVPTDSQQALLGVAKGSDIYLSLKTFVSIESLIGTIIHELDHVVSGISDGDLAFRSLADERIADLVLKHYGQK